MILITSSYYKEIQEQLLGLGYEMIFSYLHMEELAYDLWKVKSEHKKSLLELKNILYDKKSKQILEAIIHKRSTGVVEYDDICEGKQYFVEDIMKPSDYEVFVDAGSYDGATIKEFQKWCINKSHKIHAFEIDKNNYANILRKFKEDNVIIYNYGLWNENKTISFVSGGSSSRIVERGSEVAECRKLDSLINEKITFIKMDIEGAELEALEGSKKIIKKYTPKLAICLYHKPSDLWEIPLYIHQNFPGYKLFIRHHEKNYYETVLYAVTE